MARRQTFSLLTARAILRRILSGPQVLAFLPALVLGAYWSAGEGALVVVALGVPLLVLLAGGFERLSGHSDGQIDGVTGLPLAEALEARLEEALTMANTRGVKTALFLLQVEDFEDLHKRLGTSAGERVLEHCAARLRSVLREGDDLSWMGEGTFGIALRAVPNLDLETGIQLATRLQAAAEEPVSFSGSAVYVSTAVGFCLSSRSPAGSGRGMIKGASIALDEARRNGPSAIRSYSSELGQARASRDTLRDDALRALENGEVEPWFQPQVSTDTGKVTGFEALARWVHPRRGIVPPAEFLPIFEQAGQMERLGEVMPYGALQAITAWDAAGADVPCVAVNFSGDELQNPKLADKIRWDLDRFDLSPDRLTVEVLETVVVGTPEEIATQNIIKLSEMGCRIDLDDFGTGHASISAIRRFAIERIKIDRSFVTNVDDDSEQQRMVSAILSMADRLGLETLAEGVETAGEHAMLAQLGCRHVQGFGIARPMPLADTVGWIRDHQARLSPPPSIGRKSG
jgi:diguanylate cyclase (GGDEF)-like protein